MIFTICCLLSCWAIRKRWNDNLLDFLFFLYDFKSLNAAAWLLSLLWCQRIMAAMSISSAGLFSQLLGQNKNLTFTPDTRTLFISSVKVKASICFHNIVMSQGIWPLIFFGFKMSSLCYFYPIRQCHGYKNELLSDDHRPLTTQM